MAIQVAVNNLTVDIESLKAPHWSWEGRCHCEHVDGCTAQLLALSEQVQFLLAQAAAQPPLATHPAPAAAPASHSQSEEAAATTAIMAEAATCPGALLRPSGATASATAGTSQTS